MTYPITLQQLPINHQRLFEFAIGRAVSSFGEFGGYHDLWVLRHWARGYAKAHGLNLPRDPAVYGIFYEPDEEELAELKAEGLI